MVQDLQGVTRKILLVDDERGVDQAGEHPEQELGVVGRVRRARRETTGGLGQRLNRISTR